MRSLASSFRRRAETWFLTVPSARTRVSAISGFVSPRATSSATMRSPRVSIARGSSQESLVRIAAFATRGSITIPPSITACNAAVSPSTDVSFAGKFITVYPSSDEEFAFALDELNGLLAGGEGPYILSDKRWRSGPVYFRYGAFVPPSDDAPFVSTLIDPEGNEVEDPRRPTYNPKRTICE